jgi:TetR/AcrR family transcriptional regulator
VKTPPADLAQRLMAASDTILDGGSDVRLEDVAARVGVARTTLYYYFSGRDDLVAFLLAEHLRDGASTIASAAAGDDPVAARLRRVTIALLDLLGKHPGLCTGLLASLGAAGRMDEVLAANDALIVTPVRTLVAEGIKAREVRNGDAGDIASALLGAILFVVLSRTAQGRPVSDADQISENLLRGPLR